MLKCLLVEIHAAIIIFIFFFYKNSKGDIQKQDISQFSHTQIIFAVEQVRDVRVS